MPLTLSVDAKMHLQRPALLLSGGTVYIAFGSHQDTTPYHGWILAYDAQTLQLQTKPFSTTPNGSEGRGGIWQSGNGLAADTNSNIYAMTGNGPVGDGNYGDSFIKLDPRLAVIDSFTPRDYNYMDEADADLGSAGPMLLPGGTLLGGGKRGIFYLLDQSHLGGLQSGQNNPLQEFQAAKAADNTWPDAIADALDAAAILAGPGAGIIIEIANWVRSTEFCGFDNHHIHGSPVVWSSPKDGPLVYIWAERDYLKAFKYDPAARRFSNTSPAYRSSMEDPDHGGQLATKFMPGAALSLSANGSTPGSGIVWASLPAFSDAVASLAPGLLRAFDAGDVGHELWCAGTGTFAKFSAPTVANGRVYLATFDNRVNVYGLGATTSGDLNLGGYYTKSSPFVADGYVYFQGGGSIANELYKVSITNPNGDNTWLGGYKTLSTPFVADGYVYFQGTGNRLFKVSVTNPNGDNTWLGGYKTLSTPFVANGYVYFQGTDDRLFKVSVTNPNGDNTWLGGYKTRSAPFVDSGYVYFEADDGVSDHALWRVPVDGSAGSIPGCLSRTLSTPVATAGRVYYQATDNRLMAVAE